jgi:predicted dehydrogenase
MAQNNIVLALIGKGKWGQSYIKTISKLKNCILPPQNIKTSDYADLLDNNNISGVIIASPTVTHYTIAKAFLEKGFNILVEKPITKTYDEALKLQKIALKHPQQTIMAGHLQLYNPGYQLFKNLLPRIGIIKSLEYLGLQSPIRIDATVVEDWGAHPTYLFMDILGQGPQLVKAEKEKHDNIKLTYLFKNKTTGYANIGWISKVKKRLLIINGNKGKLTLDDLNKKIILKIDEHSSVYSFENKTNPLQLELIEFISSIKEKRQPISNMKQAVSVMKILDRLNQSLQP